MGRREVVQIVSGEGWNLVHNGKRIGPYSTENEALYVAQVWAEGARRQGIIIEFVTPDEERVEQPSSEPGSGDNSGERQM